LSSPPPPPDLAGVLTQGEDAITMMQSSSCSEQVEDCLAADGCDRQMSIIARRHVGAPVPTNQSPPSGPYIVDVLVCIVET
jgi:hypothetical protein